MKYIYIILFIALLGCVQNQTEGEKSDLTIISVDYEDRNIFSLSSLSDDISYVKLETNDSCLIKEINKIFYIDENIIIGSENTILFFDQSGNFKHVINRQGMGPEDYIRLSDFDICPKSKTILILDTAKKKLIEYDFLGNFKRKHDIENGYIGVQHLDDATVVLYSGNQASSNNNMKFGLYNLKTASFSQNFYPIIKQKSKYLHTHSSNNFSKSNNQVLFCELYNDTIYTVTNSGCVPFYYLEFGKSKIPPSFFYKNYSNIMEFQEKLLKHNFSYGINSLANTSKHLLVSFYKNNKKCLLYFDKKTNNSVAFRRFNDEKIFGDFIIDALKYRVSFYSDRNYLFTVADNDLYLTQKGYIKNSLLKKLSDDIAIDDNPIIRICKIK